ncbi:MAG: 9-O-acetylesterase [Armatimonadetes bacterium]|nr:9-O-acetylesterase [Armatimonadota bacterium]
MKHRQAATLAALAVLAFPAAPSANAQQARKPFLHPLFTDNMVLQRGAPAPVWGWTTPGAAVSVTVAGKTVAGKAAADGKWMVRVGPLQAATNLTVTVKGPQTVTLKNVAAGDVWLCSGQSNMQMSIGSVNYPEAEIAGANHPNIRLYTVQDTVALEPRELAPVVPDGLLGVWSVCSPASVSETAGGFSAVAYFFGRKLQKELGVPIGLIHSSWGGTIAEAWTSAAALQTMPDFRAAVANVKSAGSKTSDFEKQMQDWWAANDTGSAKGYQSLTLDTSGWKTMRVPQNWNDSELSGYDGVAWFRREFELPASAAGKPAQISLGPIDDIDTTFVNGVAVGSASVWDQNRSYKVPAGVLKAGANVVAVRILDTSGPGGICGAAYQMRLEPEGSDAVGLAGVWSYATTTPMAQTKPMPARMDSNPNIATVLYNGMIAPLVPYGIKGAIWYQGESNAGRAYQYRTLLPTMIRDWRTQWKQDFPFFIVQLANFMAVDDQPKADPWPELREAQLMTAQKTPKVGMAVAIDIGDAQDIHPKNKQDVGLRLALSALSIAYGKTLEYSGPVYSGMQKTGSAIRLKFTHAAGLTAKGGELKGFAIAGADRKFVWAKARIEGAAVVVSAPGIASPVAVRYAWGNNPVCNLVNKADLPASPFRTDQWPGVTANAK